MANNDEVSSIIVLGETGTGKSSFCNNLCLQPKCKVGEELNSETERVQGIKCEGVYDDIFIIDTPGLNDSNGQEQDKRNINLMNEYIKQNPRIKGIIILLKFTDNRITGSVKQSLKAFANMFPMNDFWSHVVFILSHFYANTQDEKQKRKEKLVRNYKKEIKEIMNQTKITHPNFNIPEEIHFYFCELKNPDEETKNEILNAMRFLRAKRQMFKKIEVREEEPRIVNTNKLGNTTTVEYVKEKITTFTDFDDTQTESRKIIDSWNENYIEERETEVKEKVEGEKKIFEHFVYKKMIHKNRNDEEDINVDKKNPIEHYIETEEMIYLPEETNSITEGNKTTITHLFYKQLKFVDKNSKETYGNKILVNSYNTYKEIIEEEPLTKNEGNTQIINYRRKNKYTDKDGNITYDEPEIYKTDTHVTYTNTVVERYYESDDDDCFIF
jgi:GTP-binding protein EngB required for normal cell division